MAMTDFTTERKSWHNAEATMGRCKVCGGPVEETVAYLPDPVGAIYDLVCKNPDCPSNNY